MELWAADGNGQSPSGGSRSEHVMIQRIKILGPLNFSRPVLRIRAEQKNTYPEVQTILSRQCVTSSHVMYGTKNMLSDRQQGGSQKHIVLGV